MKSPSPGMRTFCFGLAALAFLLVGFSLALTMPKIGEAIFAGYATAVVGVFWGVAGKHSIESLAQGTGIAGAKAALMTAATPPEAKP